jgi:hypothetical protein
LFSLQQEVTDYVPPPLSKASYGCAVSVAARASQLNALFAVPICGVMPDRISH